MQRSVSWKMSTARRLLLLLLKTNGRCAGRQMEKAKRLAARLLQDEWSDRQTADGSTNIAALWKLFALFQSRLGSDEVSNVR